MDGIRQGALGGLLGGAGNPGNTALRLHWKTDAFGRIDLHTTLEDNRVGVTLHSERGDLRGMLGAESTRFDANLQRHDLRLHELLFTEREAAPSMDFSGGKNQDQAHHGPLNHSPTATVSPPGVVADRGMRQANTAPPGGGLSVRV